MECDEQSLGIRIAGQRQRAVWDDISRPDHLPTLLEPAEPDRHTELSLDNVTLGHKVVIEIKLGWTKEPDHRGGHFIHAAPLCPRIVAASASVTTRLRVASARSRLSFLA